MKTKTSSRKASAARALAAIALAGLCGARGSAGRQTAAAIEPAEPAAGQPGGHTVVVELFTSQGCSSCPPADLLLTRLGETGAGRIVPLAFHVDYWNHGGWTDLFSSREWSERQAAYARALGVNQIYTPQAVVDGAAEVVGSREEALQAAVRKAAARPSATISLSLRPEASGVLATAEIEVPEAIRGRKLDLMMAVYETGLVTPVGRGENGGHTLHDDYVVRSLRREARLKAGGPARVRQEAALPLKKEWNRSNLGVAVFLQDPQSLEIRGAAARALTSTSADREAPRSSLSVTSSSVRTSRKS